MYKVSSQKYTRDIRKHSSFQKHRKSFVALTNTFILQMHVKPLTKKLFNKKNVGDIILVLMFHHSILLSDTFFLRFVIF